MLNHVDNMLRQLFLARVDDITDEAQVRFRFPERSRNARDAWITSLNSYATAMGQPPRMPNGAVRLKAIQDWLANDGHNALLIGF